MQTWAIILDTLRLLRARRLFWLSMAISTLIGLMLLSIDFTATGWRIGFGLLSFESAEIRQGVPMAEGMLFGYFDYTVRWWLTLFGIILALLTTSSIFSEMLSPGAIEWMASKPVSRARLYLTKYLSALLIAALQAGVVVLGLWLAVKWRLGFWHHVVWWTVPLVVLFYSSLYAITSWIGLKTKSALTAVLVTVLFWAGLGSLQFAEHLCGKLSRTSDATSVTGMLQLGDETLTRASAERGRRLLSAIMTVLPKTAEMTALTGRLIERRVDGYGRDRLLAKRLGAAESDLPSLEKMMLEDRLAMRALAKSTWAVVASALLFQIVFVYLGCRRFQRQDC